MKKFLVLILVFMSTTLFAERQPEGFGNVQFASMTLAANATGSISVSNLVQKAILVGDGSAFSFTVNTSTGTVYIASQPTQWEQYPGTFSVELLQQLPRNSFIWLQNGATPQKIRFKGYSW